MKQVYYVIENGKPVKKTREVSVERSTTEAIKNSAPTKGSRVVSQGEHWLPIYSTKVETYTNKKGEPCQRIIHVNPQTGKQELYTEDGVQKYKSFLLNADNKISNSLVFGEKVLTPNIKIYGSNGDDDVYANISVWLLQDIESVALDENWHGDVVKKYAEPEPYEGDFLMKASYGEKQGFVSSFNEWSTFVEFDGTVESVFNTEVMAELEKYRRSLDTATVVVLKLFKVQIQGADYYQVFFAEKKSSNYSLKTPTIING